VMAVVAVVAVVVRGGEGRGRVLYCTVPYRTVLYCTVLYCTVLYRTVLYYTIPAPLAAQIRQCLSGGRWSGVTKWQQQSQSKSNIVWI
jgi:hypothetical protein